MTWELDHVFFATADGDSVEQRLSEFGLVFTERRVHRGQGTANACAIFENTFFEVLRPDDPDERRSALVRPLGLDERIHWRDTGACRFGLCFQPRDANAPSTPSPFETWPYEAAYLPKGASIPIVTPAHALAEPLVFLMPRRRPPAATPSPSHRGVRAGSEDKLHFGSRQVSKQSIDVRFCAKRCPVAAEEPVFPRGCSLRSPPAPA